MVSIGSGIAGGAVGAQYGSAFGAPGALIGGGIGAGLGLFGGGKKRKRTSLFDPQQQQLYNDYTQGLYGEGPFADLYQFNPEQANQVFEQNYVQPAYRQYEESVVPQITGQFRGQNLMNSSYTGEALSKAGRDVQENLNALRTKYLYEQEQNVNQRRDQGLRNVLGMTTFDYERQPNSIDQILAQLGPEAGQWLRDYMRRRGR